MMACREARVQAYHATDSCTRVTVADACEPETPETTGLLLHADISGCRLESAQ